MNLAIVRHLTNYYPFNSLWKNLQKRSARMVANRAQSTTTQQLKANVSNQHQRSPSLKGKHSHSLKEKSWSLLQVSYELNRNKKGWVNSTCTQSIFIYQNRGHSSK